MKLRRALALLSASLLTIVGTAPVSAQSTQWVFCAARGGNHYYYSDMFEVRWGTSSSYLDEWDDYLDYFTEQRNLPYVTSSDCYPFSSYEDTLVASDDDYAYYYDDGWTIHSLNVFDDGTQ